MCIRDRYETAPWGVEEQPAYLNQVISLTTEKEAKRVLQAALAIEKELGRERRLRWGARVIDIDVLFYGNKILTSEEDVYKRQASFKPCSTASQTDSGGV